MLKFRDVYRELRLPVLRTGAILVAVTVLVAAAALFNRQMQNQQLSAEQTLRDTVLDYRNSIDAERILKTQTSRFRALRAEGFVGPEPRLRWIEDVREIAERSDLVAVKYELGARAAHPGNLPSATYQLYVSPMKLELQLRHEGDLLTFLNLLEGRRGGLFELASCSLNRLRESGVSLTDANVGASCQLLWYSLDAPQAVMGDEF